MSQSVSTAATWTVGARVAERVLSLISMAILARALTPADFGLIAMAGAIVAVVEVFSAFGFDWAVVRQPAATREHYNTAWTLRIIVNAVVMVVLCAAAYPIAEFYDRQELIGVVLVMALTVLVGAVENIWVVEFRRNFRFDREFWLRTIGKLVGFCVAVTLALSFHSYWALVLGVLASRLATTTSSYLMHPGRPSFSVSRRRELMSFSVWLMIGNAADLVRHRFGEAFIGRAFGAQPLGLFSVASELANLGSTEFAAPINRAVFSRYAQIEGDVAALRRDFLRVSALIWAIGIPAAIGVATTAPQFVPLLLGDQWTEAVLLIQIISIWGALGVISGNSGYVFWAMGRSRFVSWLSIVGLVLYVCFILALARPFGLTGVAWAQVLTGFSVVSINYWALMRLLKLSLWEILAGVWRVIVAAVLMGALVGTASSLLMAAGAAPLIIQFVILVIGGFSFYVASLVILWLCSGRPAGVERDILEFVIGRLRPATLVP